MIDTCVIFCGGKGTRLEEVTRGLVPKPLVPINSYPLLYLIMRYYVRNGVSRFYLLAGHQAIQIKKFARDISLYDSTLVVLDNKVSANNTIFSGVTINVIDTGEETQTAGRLSRLERMLEVENFYLTYGDGVSDVDLELLTQMHTTNDATLTLTSVNPPGRFGDLEMNENNVRSIKEKSTQNTHWINGGFMCANRRVFDYLRAENIELMPLELDPMSSIASDGKLFAHKHHGFWQCCDNRRDWEQLCALLHGHQLDWIF